MIVWFIMTEKNIEENKERYANVSNMHVSAAVDSLYRFENIESAVEKMESIKQMFTVAANQEKDPPKPCVILWIKDFDISKDEEKKGFMGNYAFLTYEELPDGLYTLSATKLDTDLKYHPRRKRQESPMPNWGHPILRYIKKGRTYERIEDAEATLQKLHLEYPQTTIPARNALHVMIFCRKEDPKNPVQKYTLEIENVKGGGFTIECKKNEYKARPDPLAGRKTAEISNEENPPPMGHWASLIATKRKKKG